MNMKVSIVFSFALMLVVASFGQPTRHTTLSLSSIDGQNNNWLIRQLKIFPKNTLKIRQRTNSYGIEHTRYEQYHEGCRIVGASFVAHAEEREITVNGNWVVDFSRKGVVAISEGEALGKALNTFEKGTRFYWENTKLCDALVNGDSQKLYPSPTLVWYDKEYSKNAKAYRLAYEMDVLVDAPRSKYKIYIDAESGLVLDKYGSMYEVNTPATGNGVYNSNVSFTVDSVSGNKFELHEEQYLGHTDIATMDWGGDNIIDNNNKWGELGEESDMVAVDVHWGAEKTLDYFDENFGRHGMAGTGESLVSYVHMPIANAFYDGYTLSFGDGDETKGIGPLTDISVVSHEFMHGVTAHEANLVFSGEPGGINESLSDIFSICVEHSVYPDSYNWVLGEKVGWVYRNMADPKSLEMASTYGGQYWDSNDDVHKLSSIGNLWYYLLVEGGAGENDNGLSYNVSGIGFSKAQDIVYECLTNYLTEVSFYQDFRDVSIDVASNMYGECSSEMFAVAAAWEAVGVGESLHENDLILRKVLSPVSGCGLAMESVIVEMEYSSCLDSLPMGTVLEMHYSVNGGAMISESYPLPITLKSGDKVQYTFGTPVDISSGDNYEIKVWFVNPNDGLVDNDIQIANIENRSNLGQDFEILDVNSFSSLYCDESFPPFVLEMQYWGCDDIPVNEPFSVQIDVTKGSEKFSENVISVSTEVLKDGQKFSLLVNPTLSGLLALGLSKVKISVNYPNDIDSQNNFIYRDVTFAKGEADVAPFLFDGFQDINRFDVEFGALHQPNDLISYAGPGVSALLLVGGDYYGNIEEPMSADDVWDVNKGFITTLCFCVDATESESVTLDFDMKQEAGVFYYSQNGFSDPTLFCNMRVKINNDVISPTYRPFLDSNEFHHEYFDLSAYAGTNFRLCFESQNVSKSFVFFSGDELYLDNIFIEQNSVVRQQTPKKEMFKVEVLPNPASDYLEIKGVLGRLAEVQYYLYSVAGKSVASGQFEANGYFAEVVDLSNVPAGVYLLKMGTDAITKVIRVVKGL